MNAITVEELLPLINAADPMGLYVDDETNFDEYKGEAEEIIARYSALERINLSAMTKIVTDVFDAWFEGVDVQRDPLGQLARDVYILATHK